MVRMVWQDLQDQLEIGVYQGLTEEQGLEETLDQRVEPVFQGTPGSKDHRARRVLEVPLVPRAAAADQVRQVCREDKDQLVGRVILEFRDLQDQQDLGDQMVR